MYNEHGNGMVGHGSADFIQQFLFLKMSCRRRTLQPSAAIVNYNCIQLKST